MVDLAAFITARLDEDEAWANTATPAPWRATGVDIVSEAADPHWRGACAANASGVDGEHIARHDPARALREVAARRRTMARHEREADKQQPWCAWCTDDRHFEAWPCDDIRDLVATWSDHDDYRPEWARGL